MNTQVKPKTITDYRDLKSSPFYPFEINENEPDFFKNQKEKGKSVFQKVKNKIDKAENKEEIIAHFKQNLLESLDYLLKFIKKSKVGDALDRNQGLIIENYIFGKVINAIKDALSLGITLPQFYYNPDSDFNETELKKILEEFKSKIESGNFNDYFELEALSETYLKKIQELWVKENEKLGVK